MVDALGYAVRQLDPDAFAAFESAFLKEGLELSNSRNLLQFSESVLAFAASPTMLAFAGCEAFPVCARLFNKTPEVNWLVPWHQDLTIRVRERRDVPGYGPWSRKDGVDHVQPPVHVLEKMLAIRIHLDRADAGNGGLRVLPGSHRMGRLSAAQIDSLAAEIEPVSCDANRGEALLMRPLLLHASSRAVDPAARRVIHIEYATCGLDGGLEWLGHYSPFDIQMEVGHTSIRMPNEDRAGVLQGTLDLMILQTLSVMGPQHGYAIAARLEQVSDGALQLNMGTLYPGLTRLESRGWISAKWALTESNRRARFYELTAKGRKQLQQERAEWLRVTNIMAKVLE